MSGPNVTVADIDRLLTGLRTSAASVGAALLELDDERSRRRIDAARLRGASAAAWATSTDQMAVLWCWFQALSETLDAVNQRRSAPRFRDREAAELWQDLATPMVAPPPDAVLLHNSVAGIDSTAPMTLVAVADALRSGYQAAAETVTSLAAVWDVVAPRLAELDRALTGIEDEARRARVRLPNEAFAVREGIARMSGVAAADPLTLNTGEVAATADAIDRVRAAVADGVASERTLGDSVERLRGDLSGIATLIEEAVEENEDALAKVDGAQDSRSELRALAATAADFQRELDEAASGDRPGVAVVRALDGRVSELRGRALQLARDAAAPLARRRELRARLDAYRAKAQALGRGEDLGLGRLYTAARDSLYTAPCDLSAAERQVITYQRALTPSPRPEVDPEDAPS